MRRGFSVFDVAFDVGYRDGLQAGRYDRAVNATFDPEAHSRFRDALHGYNVRFGDEDTYRCFYREGYRVGYQDGYGGR